MHGFYTDTLVGETIPIRLFLGGFDLTPTFREVNKKYSTRYYLSLVLIDEGQFLAHPSHQQSQILSSSCSPRLNESLALTLKDTLPSWSEPLLNAHIGNFLFLTARPRRSQSSTYMRTPQANHFTDARRYFKQSEIVLYRQAPEEARALALDAPSIGGKLPTQTPPIPA